MIKYWKQTPQGYTPIESYEPHCWINVTAPSPDEIAKLCREYEIPTEVISDILDPDERSRVEKEDDWLLAIVRIPIHDREDEVPYGTIPLGIILVKKAIITVSLKEGALQKEFLDNRVRNLQLTDKAAFILQVFMRSAILYLQYLKEINRETADLERNLQKAIKNTELIKLLLLEKSLVLFITSLKSNELTLERIQRGNLLRMDEDDRDLLEDGIIENRQAIETANIYSNILSGMMDAFASIISNNVNIIMKKLTSLSIVLMIPTLIASLFGMNVHVPLQSSPWAFASIALGSCLLSLLLALAFVRRKMI